MLNQEMLSALKSYTANMKNDVALIVQTGDHEKRPELLKFLNDFASVSNRIQVVERDTGSQLRSPVSFMIEVEGQPSGISFSGIPGGHEFNSLVLAILQLSGTPMKLDEQIKSMIAQIREPLQFEVFVSLSCHNCPDVVQALNQFAMLNSNISTEMIDGGVYPELIEQRNIQGVPAVYLNGEVFANGKIDTAQLLDKLLQNYPHIAQENTASELPLQDVTIIGGGPAGAAAAIYSARKGLKVTLIADRIGGQVKDTMGIENLISIPSTTGPELVTAMQTHMKDYDITLKEHLRVSRIETGKIKILHLTSGEQISTKTIIIATGANWRELGVPGE
jgi:alkyl hydroperoxide reductase subunit F